MWLVFGLAAIVFAVLNWRRALGGRDASRFRFISLSLTILTLCSFYSDAANRVLCGDWAGLMDVAPTMSKALWICSAASILINSVTLFQEKK